MSSIEYYERKLWREKEIGSKSIVVIGKSSNSKIAILNISRLFKFKLLLVMCNGSMLHVMQMYGVLQNYFSWCRFSKKISFS